MKRSIGTIRYIKDCPLRTKIGCGTMSLHRCRECKHHSSIEASDLFLGGESVNCNHSDPDPI